jgi:hypothetical protein
MLLVGAIEACALYQGVRAVIAFRTARSHRDVGRANLRALSAIACVALGLGGAFRYIGLTLLLTAIVAYALTARAERQRPVALETHNGD